MTNLSSVQSLSCVRLFVTPLIAACQTSLSITNSQSLLKLMPNLDSILKSRDITLPTKVCLVKAMVFPVVMYGCESWTVKKAERQTIDALELWNYGVGEDLRVFSSTTIQKHQLY